MAKENAKQKKVVEALNLIDDIQVLILGLKHGYIVDEKIKELKNKVSKL